MCGIAGIFSPNKKVLPEREILERMIVPQRHRGPDGFGFFRGPGVGLAHARLSIIDVDGGWQPMCNEDRRVWTVFNGEIFNFQEIQKNLEKRGHRFSTRSDTEVLVHLYEDLGFQGMLRELNGQFAIALYDVANRTLFLARDQVGIHPLHYRISNGWFQFASEVKGLLGLDNGSSAKIDPQALDQTFTFWGPLSGRSLFYDVKEVPPGCYLKLKRLKPEVIRYWDVPLGFYPEDNSRSLKNYAEELGWLLKDATRLRLIADVPVGTYLSGGLDSSIVTYLTRTLTGPNLKTFSVAFEDKDFDESSYQKILNDKLNTDNFAIKVADGSICSAFEKVIWHTEKPVLRTAPTPLFLLSSSVNTSNYKTILTGEGADEFFGGYDIFKEALLRSFWRRNSDSTMRTSLFQKLYPYIKMFSQGPTNYLKEYFRIPAPGWDDLFSSHWVRWMTTSRIKHFYTEDFKKLLEDYDPVIEIQDKMRDRMVELNTLARAQYLEIQTLLPNYLLSSQGDRMSMANSVEVRFPFLDPRVIELSCRVPSYYKILGLNEKVVLKNAMRGQLPEEIVNRHKRPYMAPDIPSFLNKKSDLSSMAKNFLSHEKVRSHGVFKSSMVENLKKKCILGRAIGFGDNMALVGILSTQIWLDTFTYGKPLNFVFDDQSVKRDIIINGGDHEKH
jgi:asparagine synthase (glutamine-hydrolysing)